MNKRRFTLIKLLTIIIILGVIALILTPIITNIIENANEKSAEQSINSYIEAANNATAISLIDNQKGITITSDKYKLVTGTNDEDISKIEVSGITPSYVYLEYNYSTKSVTIGHFCIKGYDIDYNNGVTSRSVNNYCSIGIDAPQSHAINVSIPVGQYMVLTMENSEGDISWSSSNESIPTVTSSGLVNGLSIGTSIITAISTAATSTFNINVISNSILCNYEIGHSWTFDYTGNTENFIVPCDGTYQLEVWGAQGGTTPTNYRGGYGAYSMGNVEYNINSILYINVGGAGKSGPTAVINTYAGGYNGGGTGYVNRTSCAQTAASGGGATSIGLENFGPLKNFSSSINKILIVASGGGGAFTEYCAENDNANIIGGDGGGIVGSSAVYVSRSGFSNMNPTGGTQTYGGYSLNNWTDTTYTTTYSGSFGQGASGGSSYSGGGGGYYGGASGVWQPGAGGSGYIGNSLLSNKHMTCYNCTTSNDESTKTISSTDVSSTPISNYSKIGNGYAKITLISY